MLVGQNGCDESWKNVHPGVRKRGVSLSRNVSWNKTTRGGTKHSHLTKKHTAITEMADNSAYRGPCTYEWSLNTASLVGLHIPFMLSS